MAALAGCFYPGLRGQITHFEKGKGNFLAYFAQASLLRDRTISQLDKLGTLSVDNLEAKIVDLQELMAKIEKIGETLSNLDQSITDKIVYGQSKDTIVRCCVYGFSGVGALMGVFSDFADDMVDRCNIPVAYKVYRAAATFVILPFIFSIEQSIKAREKLRGDVKELLTDLEERYYGIETFYNYLLHRKEALEIQNNPSSILDNNKIVNILQEVHDFTDHRVEHNAKSTYHHEILRLAEARMKGACAKDQILLSEAVDKIKSRAEKRCIVFANRGLKRFKSAVKRVSDPNEKKEVVQHGQIEEQLESTIPVEVRLENSGHKQCQENPSRRRQSPGTGSDEIV